MTNYTATFDPAQFEYTGLKNFYLSPSQTEQVDVTIARVEGQLDWVAQMLGWNGPNYWTNLPTTVNQKRQLLGGSFGVYNGYIFPVVREVRNWSNEVIVNADPQLNGVQTFYLGDIVLELQELTVEGDKYVLSFGALSDNFYAQIAAGEQLKARSNSLLPAPFSRTEPGVAANQDFHCGLKDGALCLYPLSDVQETQPYVFNTLVQGATYFFDQCVYLAAAGTTTQVVTASYSEDRQLWYFTVPTLFSENQLGGVANLVWSYADPDSYSPAVLTVNVKRWVDPSDWKFDDVVNYYTGTWGNKGGALPFNFVLDSLSIHGFNERTSIQTDPIQRAVSFDTLLNFVYSQQSSVDPNGPAGPQTDDVWWNPSNGCFSVWRGESWQGVTYSDALPNGLQCDIIYSDSVDFLANGPDVEPGTLVQVFNANGLTFSDPVLGLQGTLAGNGVLYTYFDETQNCWIPVRFLYQNESVFDTDAAALPFGVEIVILNANLLSPSGVNYEIDNLGLTIGEDLPVLLRREDRNVWRLSPFNGMKYIGKTRLYESLVNPTPVSGELYWNYEEDQSIARRASIFYYNRWEKVEDEWVLMGDWVDLNSGYQVDAPEQYLNFGAISVYCDGEMFPNGGGTIVRDSFTLTLEMDAETGNFIFTYTPGTFESGVNFPSVTISDSLVYGFTHDITDLVFSGVTHYMSPNVADSETLLRLWKAQQLCAAGTLQHLAEDNYINPLVADQNNGPGSPNWDRFFLRLPPSYTRNGTAWQKVNLVCTNFAYYGSNVAPDKTICPGTIALPEVYEAAYLFGTSPETRLIYSEPYLYSDVAFSSVAISEAFENSGVYPTQDVLADDYYEAKLVTYEPLHVRQVREDGDWEGVYLRENEEHSLSGFTTNDVADESLIPTEAPVWDASIYKLPPSCVVAGNTFDVDANQFKIGYAYFAADLSAAEDGFFDIGQESAWFDPQNLQRTLYVKHRVPIQVAG
jgi:hypothetical protein